MLSFIANMPSVPRLSNSTSSRQELREAALTSRPPQSPQPRTGTVETQRPGRRFLVVLLRALASWTV